MFKGRVLLILTFLTLIGLLTPSLAIDLRLHRDYGTSMGGKIKGTFSARVKAVEGLQKVEFYLDDDLGETVAEEPFRWTFKTTDFPDGNYTIKAIAFFADGSREEDSVRTQFVTSFGQWWTMYLMGTVVFVVAIMLFTVWRVNKERKSPKGKTKCPQCGTIFERKWSAMHKGNAYRNTCPICNKTFWADEIKEEKGS